MTNLPVFLINLDRAVEKRAAVEKQLQDLGISFRRFPAIDGRELSEERVKEICDQTAAQRILGRPIGNSEIGCYLSHMEIYKIMAQENLPAALILEDDVHLTEDLPHVLREWERFPGHCRILQLIPANKIGRLRKKCFRDVRNIHLPSGYTAARNHDICYGTAAYIIRCSYAKELLTLGMPVRAPVDSLLFDWKHNFCIPWILYKKRKDEKGRYPTVGTHEDEQSQIDEERRTLQKKMYANLTIRRKIKNVIHHHIHALFRDAKKYFLLPLNRGGKKSLLQIRPPHTLLTHIKVWFSCMVFPGQDAYAEALRTRKTPPVFVINLKKSKSRLRWMKEQLERMNIHFEVIEAVDGLEIPAEELNKIYNPALVRKKIGREMTRQEIGCYLSHMKAFQLMAERDIPEAIILEDDVQLREEFTEVLNTIQLPEECRILQIAGSGIGRMRRKYFSPYHMLRLPNGYKFGVYAGVIYGTQGYMIRQSYARQLLRERNPIQTPIDTMMFHWRYNFCLPWGIFRNTSRSRGRMRYRMLGWQKKESWISTTIPRDYIVKSGLPNWLVGRIVQLVHGCILRWLWPWNPGEKISALHDNAKPGFLQKLKILVSCHTPPPPGRPERFPV